jgi:hypothetical protein
MTNSKIFEFCFDHVKFFGFMPMEVELDDEVLNWDEYQKKLTDEEHLILSKEIEKHE